MASSFPAAADSFTAVPPGGKQGTAYGGRKHSESHNDMGDVIEALIAKLGIGASTPTNIDDVLYVTGTGATAFGKRGLSKIAEASGTGASGVITFSSIPATYRELEITVFGRGDTAATNVNCRMTINGNSTATDYDSEHGLASGISTTAVEHLGDVGYIDAGNFPAASSTSNLYSSTKLWLPEYANTSPWKVVQFLTSNLLTLLTGNLTPRFGAAAFESTAAISSLTFTLSAGNWTTASRITLWGMMA